MQTKVTFIISACRGMVFWLGQAEKPEGMHIMYKVIPSKAYLRAYTTHSLLLPVKTGTETIYFAFYEGMIKAGPGMLLVFQILYFFIPLRS